MSTKPKSKIEDAEETFAKTESCIAALRAFFSKHAASLEQFSWRAYGWNDKEITVDSHQYGEKRLTPKEIAALFGLDGWVRQHSTFACGAIDWVKHLDGCVLKIENAESIRPKLIEEVKFHQSEPTTPAAATEQQP